jgi:hypothetical protein
MRISFSKLVLEILSSSSFFKFFCEMQSSEARDGPGNRDLPPGWVSTFLKTYIIF